MKLDASVLSRVLLGALIAAWAAAASLFLLHRIVVTNDSLSNYAHVWLISEHLRETHWLPWKLPELLHGTAQAYPYGFIPWTLAALLQPAVGDWVSTLWMVVGTAGVIAGTFAAFPELRKALPAACVLANPVLVEMFVLFQLPFAWAMATFLWAIWAFRRERWTLAAVLAGLAQATHAPVLMPIAAIVVALALWRIPQRRHGLVIGYAISLAIATPAAVIALTSPVVEDASRATLAANLVGTVTWRSLVVAVPMVVALGTRRRETWLLRATVALVLLNPLLIPFRHNGFAWGLFFREPDGQVAGFTRTAEFVPGATYRILRADDGKVGMYQLIRAGAHLDSEFFPESIDRRSWPSQRVYATFLAGRSVEFVIIFATYDQTFGTNEGSLLQTMVGNNCAAVVKRNVVYVVYEVRPAECGALP